MTDRTDSNFNFRKIFVGLISRKLKRFLRIILDLISVLIGFKYLTKQRYLPPIDNRIVLEQY
jgi:hypothetical protein